VGAARESLLSRRVEDVKAEQLRELAPLAARLVEMYERMGGFSARHVARAVEVAREMVGDESCTVFLAFTANLVATGLRGVLAALIDEGLVDAVVTTGGTFDHDIARSFASYYLGEFEIDDSMLREMDVHRLGNVLVPRESYGPVVEEFTHRMLEELVGRKSRWTPSELAREAGLRLKDEASILACRRQEGGAGFLAGYRGLGLRNSDLHV
jgi:deoxyhypusine synthase